jgi:hypothetical protein
MNLTHSLDPKEIAVSRSIFANQNTGPKTSSGPTEAEGNIGRKKQHENELKNDRDKQQQRRRLNEPPKPHNAYSHEFGHRIAFQFGHPAKKSFNERQHFPRSSVHDVLDLSIPVDMIHVPRGQELHRPKLRSRKFDTSLSPEVVTR